MTVTLQVLHVADCPNLALMLDRLGQVTDIPVATRQVDTDAEASALGMAGSPTLLINGADPFTEPGPGDFAVSCRLYRDEQGRIVPVPSVDQLRDAITSATATAVATSGIGEAAAPAEVLSAWRTRALPLDPVEKAMQQAILRAFATTGDPPALVDLDPITAGTSRGTAEVLAALHDVDAIRVASDGQIAVAYPFSSTPTRHRVRIADQVDVHAMCAIDALGIAALVGHDTRIESVDVTTGQPVIVTMSGGRATWEPRGAVVVIGADAGGGPSADSCCDYLNFFADPDGAQAWIDAHPQIPGQVLTQAEAQSLGTRLFQPLLTN